MPTIAELLHPQPATKRPCGCCVHCRVHGVNVHGDAHCHCAFVLWRDKQGRTVKAKTVLAAMRMRVECDRFEE